MTRWRIAAALLICAAIASFLGYRIQSRGDAAAGALPEILDLVPPDSSLVAYANVAALRSAPLVQRLIALAQPASVDRDYADFMSATGFDYQRDLDRVVIASRADQPGQVLAFADGRFDRDKIARYALRSGRIEHEPSHDVYVMPSATRGKNISLFFLSASRLGIADGGDFPWPSKAAPRDPAMRERLSRVAGTPLFAVANSSALSSSASTGFVPSANLTFLQSFRWISLAAQPDGEQVLISAEGDCTSDAQAQSIAATLDFLRKILGNSLANPKARGHMTAETAALTAHLLEGARVSTEGQRVRLLLTVTPEMIGAPAPH
jgi:hypothetical protein